MNNDQPKSFFRFRPTSALLERFQELEKQQIYFASLAELNDPFEGSKDVFWNGDCILWENLLRHYLMCLTRAVVTALVNGPDHGFGDVSELVIANESDVSTKEFGNLLAAACENFFRHRDIESLPSFFAEHAGPIRSEELTSYLRILHLHALNSILVGAETLNLIPMRPEEDPIRLASGKDIQIRTVLEARRQGQARHPDMQNFSEVTSGVSEINALQQDLIREYNGVSLQKGVAWKLLIGEFPKPYVRALQQLMYRDWYTACFVSDPTNSAMWGNYGDGHKGVCLKFRSSPNSAGTPSLRLRQVCGWRGGGGTDPEPIYGEVAHEFHVVDYSAQFIEIDFFRSLGRLTMPMLNRWYRDRKGAISPLVEDVMTESEEWRSKYWRQIEVAMTTKLPDWAHEHECRLTLHSLINDLREPSMRKPEYQFSDLEGIIFGADTPTEEKLKIMRVIEAKCRMHGRNDFEFFQAHYSRRAGKVEIARLSLLRFSGL